MVMASTKKSLGTMILNKARGIIKPNNTIEISKLTNRDQIHRKFRHKRNIRDTKLKGGKMTLMSNSAKITISGLNTTSISDRMIRIQMRGIGSHVKRSSKI
jgi:hypothetical protein